MKAKQTFLVAAALPAGVGAAWLAANRDFTPYQTAPAALGLLVGWSLIGSGVVAWRVRPDNRMGPAMVFTGFAWFASFLTDAHQPLPFTVGTAVQACYLAGFGYLILSFPSGRLNTLMERIVIWSAITLATVVQVATLWFSDSKAVLCDGCPRNVLEVVRNDALANGFAQVGDSTAYNDDQTLPLAAIAPGIIGSIVIGRQFAKKGKARGATAGAVPLAD